MNKDRLYLDGNLFLNLPKDQAGLDKKYNSMKLAGLQLYKFSNLHVDGWRLRKAEH